MPGFYIILSSPEGSLAPFSPILNKIPSIQNLNEATVEGKTIKSTPKTSYYFEKF